MKGKEICKILRQIRQQVADDNNIPYSTDECKHKGDCLGTCPKCDSEVRYITEEIQRRGLSIKKIMAAAGLTLALSSCDGISPVTHGGNRGRVPQGDVVRVCATDSTETPNNPNQSSDSTRVPRIVCHYTNYGDMMGDVPYEPEPTSRTIATRLEKLIEYPQSMIEAGVEAKVTLIFTYNKEAIANHIEVKDSPNQAFTDTVVQALEKLNGEYKEVMELEEQYYHIPIDFLLSQETKE